MNPADIRCMLCGNTRNAGLLLTECRHLLCTACARPDGRFNVTCPPCRRQCTTTQLTAGNLPVQLQRLLQNTKGLNQGFTKATELQTRLRNQNLKRVRKVVEEFTEKNKQLDKEQAGLNAKRRRGEKFMKKFTRSSEGNQASPKFTGYLEVLTEIDDRTDIDDFMTNYSDTSDSTSDTDSRASRYESKGQQPEEPRPQVKQDLSQKSPVAAPKKVENRVQNPPGVQGKRQAGGNPNRDRKINPNLPTPLRRAIEEQRKKSLESRENVERKKVKDQTSKLTGEARKKPSMQEVLRAAARKQNGGPKTSDERGPYQRNQGKPRQ